jgi:hypothetical protein
MFTSVESLKADFGVNGRDGEVNHEVHIRIGQQVGHALRAALVFFRLGPRGVHVYVSAGNDFKDLKDFGTVKLRLGNISTADDADTDFVIFHKVFMII